MKGVLFIACILFLLICSVVVEGSGTGRARRRDSAPALLGGAGPSSPRTTTPPLTRSKSVNDLLTTSFGTVSFTGLQVRTFFFSLLPFF